MAQALTRAVEEVALDAELVRCLLREQFPQQAQHPVRPVEPGGWDNRTFRVGEQLSARLRVPQAVVVAPVAARCARSRRPGG